jgi:hypothetical protein
MVDSIGAKQVKKLPYELEMQKLQQQKVEQKEKPQEQPKGVKEVSEAMAASQNDAVTYQATPGSAEAMTASAPQDKMQNNVAAVQEADEIMKNSELKTQDKKQKTDEPKEESIVAPEAKAEPGAVKTEDKTGKVKEDKPESVFKAPEPPKSAAPEKPQTKEEEKIKDPGKVEANISADTEELLKRKERKGEQPK